MNIRVPAAGTVLRVVAAVLAFATAHGAEPASSKPRVMLTNVLEIIRLSTNDLSERRHVAEIQGVVIFVSAPARRIYVQEGDEGLPVDASGPVGGIKVGQRVVARGRIAASVIRHRVSQASVEILGEGVLPAPAPSTVPRLIAGKDIMRWTALRGVVRDMVINRDRDLMIKMTHEDQAFSVKIRDYPPAMSGAVPHELMDAELELLGLSYPYNDEAGQPSTFNFYVQSTNYIRVLQAGRSDIFDRPRLPIAEAVRNPGKWHPLVKSFGTVTFHRNDILYLDDGRDVLRVELIPRYQRAFTYGGAAFEPQSPLEPGEQVEVIGSAQTSYFLAPALIHGEFRRAGRGADVAPTPVFCTDLSSGRFGGRLVSIEARLVDHRSVATRKTHRHNLVLQADGGVFQAHLEHDSAAPWNLEPNTYVRVTGVNEAQRGKFNRQSTFELRLRSPADVVAVPAPPFWRRPDLRQPLIAALGVGAVALVLILLQRLHVRRLEAQVARRTADLSGSNARLQQEVAARERAESELRVALDAEKELSQLKSSFVSMVSHEFRTPLEVILSSSHILDRYLDRLSPEKRREQLQAINESVRRMSHLMEDILLLGKFEAARMTCSPMEIDLAAVCRRCVNEMESATESVCPIRLSVDGIGQPVWADEALLVPILTNLLSNAVKYSSPGEPVEFSVKRIGAEVEFQVRDRGRGIPEADQARLFTAFHRGSNVGQISGSGLGLVIVQRCVQLHLGTLRCVSREGEGSTFTVRLPLCAPPTQPQQNASATPVARSLQ